VYVPRLLSTLSVVESATVQVGNDATIGHLVAKMQSQPSLPEVDCCSFVVSDDPDNIAYDLELTILCLFDSLRMHGANWIMSGYAS
jgi:hypothetical protein